MLQFVVNKSTLFQTIAIDSDIFFFFSNRKPVKLVLTLQLLNGKENNIYMSAEIDIFSQEMKYQEVFNIEKIHKRGG